MENKGLYRKNDFFRERADKQKQNKTKALQIFRSVASLASLLALKNTFMILCNHESNDLDGSDG